MISVNSRVIGRTAAPKDVEGVQKRGLVLEETRDNKNKKRFKVRWDGGGETVHLVNALVAILPAVVAQQQPPPMVEPAVDIDFEDQGEEPGGEEAEEELREAGDGGEVDLDAI